MPVWILEIHVKSTVAWLRGFGERRLLMADLTLYHIAPSRSSVGLWMLEEIGEPYDIHLLSMRKGTNREPAYLAVNPMGKVPALRHRDVVITERAEIGRASCRERV